MKYYGVIGNRDYIKKHGEKRPFWEYLNVQPDGWLSSLVYKREDLPESVNPMIWDCGAWSYKNQEKPMLGSKALTPDYALSLYALYAVKGSMVIAPDHMMLDGCNVSVRRRINERNAEQFIVPALENGFVPMATVHGQTIRQRVNSARRLVDMGYEHLAIGGVAVYASRKKVAIEIVETIRREFPTVYLHVLGLSSPSYFAKWTEIGVDSCDGSSHFKQAFTGGAFFTIQSCGKLLKHQAARTGEEITAPKCDCKACTTLASEGIDTRTYGSNESNMGRAAHNLNMLMVAQKIASHGQVVLVSCVGKKAEFAQEAQNLYKSAWFDKAKRYAQKYGVDWYVLSAKYGLVHFKEIIEPYDVRLPQGGDVQWAQTVADILHHKVNGAVLTVLAGKDYRDKLIPALRELGHSIYVPMSGLGIGQQLAFLDEHIVAQGQLI